MTDYSHAEMSALEECFAGKESGTILNIVLEIAALDIASFFYLRYSDKLHYIHESLMPNPDWHWFKCLNFGIKPWTSFHSVKALL